VDGTTNIIPKMDLAVLRDGYKSVMEHIYSPAFYYERVKTFLREYQPPKIKAPLDFQYIMAFFRSVFRLGIFGKERRYYWNLLVWTLFRRPALFAEAVTFAIYGYHFRKVCEVRLAAQAPMPPSKGG